MIIFFYILFIQLHNYYYYTLLMLFLIKLTKTKFITKTFFVKFIKIVHVLI